jgi:hypothetical protein
MQDSSTIIFKNDGRLVLAETCPSQTTKVRCQETLQSGAADGSANVS